jgi:hypothetical protein
MSRHEITGKDGDRFVYGYDRPTQQYFLDVVSELSNGEVTHMPWVGFDSPKREWNHGTRTALIEAMEHFGIWDLIPSQHQSAIALDLPIPEAGTSVTVFRNGRFSTEPAAEPEPHGSRDTFVPRHLARRSNRVPFVPKSEGPDGERFNAMQD